MTDPLAPPDGDSEALSAAARGLAEVARALRSGAERSASLVAVGAAAWSGDRSEQFHDAGRAVGAALAAPARRTAELAAALETYARRHREVVDEVAVARRRAEHDPGSRVACERAACEAKADLAQRAAEVAARVGAAVPHTAPVPVAEAVVLALGDRSPMLAARWWRSLDPAARAATVTALPDLVGGMDGLPAWVRDRANRMRLRDVERQVRAHLADLRSQQHGYEPYGRGLSGLGRDVGEWEQKLRALEQLRRTIALPQRQLLVLDAVDGHQLHAVVAVGDVDHARDVAVFTPGLASNVQDGLAHYDDAMAALRERSDSRTSATVTWLGYDAPQLDDVLDGWLSVGSAHLARRGAARLAGFLAGVRAARGERLHLTALGHSYGSTTTGYALADVAAGVVDDAVLFGSPGTGADAGDLNVPSGHLWDLNAEGDLVAILQRFGDLPPVTHGFEVLSSDGHHGLAAVHGHGHYLDPGTTSQYNIAAVVSGHLDDIVPAPSSVQPRRVGVLP